MFETSIPETYVYNDTSRHYVTVVLNMNVNLRFRDNFPRLYTQILSTHRIIGVILLFGGVIELKLLLAHNRVNCGVHLLL